MVLKVKSKGKEIKTSQTEKSSLHKKEDEI